MEITLADIDELRNRTGVGYREARESLEVAGGDMVKALEYLEEKAAGMEAGAEDENPAWRRVKGMLRRWHNMKIRVHVEDKTLLEVPLTIGTAGAFLYPRLTAIGIIGVLLTRCSLELKNK